MTAPLSSPEPIDLRAADGCPLRAFAWRHPDSAVPPRPVVILNPATSVRCRYYFRFAAYLFRHGCVVLAYDYRGIGESRPASSRHPSPRVLVERFHSVTASTLALSVSDDEFGTVPAVRTLIASAAPRTDVPISPYESRTYET